MMDSEEKKKTGCEDEPWTSRDKMHAMTLRIKKWLDNNELYTGGHPDRNKKKEKKDYTKLFFAGSPRNQNEEKTRGACTERERLEIKINMYCTERINTGE